ncbi:MAG: hypothetical protein AB7L76_24975 [Burkholderiaceae bacterium]
MNRLFPKLPLSPDLAFEFLGTFARAEYALKAAGFARGGTKSVEADWDGFAKAIGWHFARVKDGPFQEAATFLLTEPPRKQVLQSGRLTWRDSPPDATQTKAHHVLMMVRRVRNNMFHGAKVWSAEYGNRVRDERLIQAALVILNGVIPLNRDVQIAYDDSAF